MRFLVALIIALLALYFFMPEPDPVPVEESIIGEQVKTLRKAEGVEADYLKATEARQERLEEQLAEDGGNRP
jgi:hypothetical protein